MSDHVAGTSRQVAAGSGWTVASCPVCGETIRAYPGRTIPDNKVSEWVRAHSTRHALEHRPGWPDWDGQT